MKATWRKYSLQFKRPAGTSRGVLLEKDTYFIDISKGEAQGLGECNLFKGLSYDDLDSYEVKLDWLCKNILLDEILIRKELKKYPSILFGWEQALLNLKNGKNLYFPSYFTQGKDSIQINGLIWMGDFTYIQQQIESKLAENFSCIKLKIGTEDWEEEKKILSKIRKEFPVDRLELRVDANGAYSVEKARNVLQDLADLEIHSIEQPIKPCNWESMSMLCKETPTPIALDEELIGIFDYEEKVALIKAIAPQYLILKPSLLGGISACNAWIEIAEKHKVGWWVTSALESNIGLNAIAQWVYTLGSKMPQGLGTGGLFTNNIDSPIYSKGEYLYFEASK